MPPTAVKTNHAYTYKISRMLHQSHQRAPVFMHTRQLLSSPARRGCQGSASRPHVPVDRYGPAAMPPTDRARTAGRRDFYGPARASDIDAELAAAGSPSLCVCVCVSTCYKDFGGAYYVASPRASSVRISARRPRGRRTGAPFSHRARDV